MSDPLLPSSVEAEKGLLCSMLLDIRHVGSLCAERGITRESFHVPAHATIFTILEGRWMASRPADSIILTQALYDGGLLPECGGPGYVSEISTFVCTPVHADSYIESLQQKQTLRGIIDFALKLKERAYHDQEDVEGMLSDLTAAAGRLEGRTRKAARGIKDMVLAKLARMESGSAKVRVLQTGIYKLDHESPLVPGAMPLISGERKSGKSMLSISIAAHLMLEHRIIYFSLEDPEEAVVDRFVANLSKVPIIQHADLTRLVEWQAQAIHRAIGTLGGARISIRDDVYDLAVMAAVIRQEKASHPDLAVAFIDYAQLIRAKVRKQDTREMEVALVSRTLRLLAIELKIAIVLLVQLNQDGATRESKTLEQDCTAMWKVVATDDAKVRMLEIPFQRNGESQIKFKVSFQGHVCRFENYVPDAAQKS